MDRLIIKGPRQQRAIEALLKGPVTVKSMESNIGALNPRQNISELRRQGFNGIIKTRRFEVIDQDGKVCHPGEYFIDDSFKPMVREALEKHVVEVRARHLQANKRQNSSHDNQGGK